MPLTPERHARDLDHPNIKELPAVALEATEPGGLVYLVLVSWLLNATSHN